jgi:hypothetical protein
MTNMTGVQRTLAMPEHRKRIERYARDAPRHDAQ